VLPQLKDDLLLGGGGGAGGSVRVGRRAERGSALAPAGGWPPSLKRPSGGRARAARAPTISNDASSVSISTVARIVPRGMPSVSWRRGGGQGG
jgi:hypothetical protein